MRPIVAFPYTDPCPRAMAQLMIAAVKCVMPDLTLMQLTDLETARLPDVNAVQRLDLAEDFIAWRLAHLIQLPPQDVLLLDYDVIVRRDLTHVFALAFDLCLTRRDEADTTVTRELLKCCPHNAGVMFQKASGHPFWSEVLTLYRANPDRDGWLDGQMAIEHALARTDLDVCDLPCVLYNYTPIAPDEDLSGKFAVHYKGSHKRWLIGDLALEAELAIARRVHGRALRDAGKEPFFDSRW